MSRLKWQISFNELLNPNITANENDEAILWDNSGLNFDQDINSAITRDEVVKAVKSVKNNKANGIDNLPAEIWKTLIFTGILAVLFNKCFSDGIGVINPIPKFSMKKTHWVIGELPLHRLFIKWTATWQNQQKWVFAQRRLRSAWASAQCDQSLRCPHEESLGP